MHVRSRLTAIGVAVATAFAVGGARATVSDNASPFRSIGAILSLSPAELQTDRTASVRGVVTMNRGNTVLQDGEHAIYLYFEPNLESSAAAMELGDLVEVEGLVRPSHYAPILIVQRMALLASGPLPEPAAADIGRLFAGGDSGRRVVVTGVAQEVLERERSDTWPVVIAWMSRRVIAILPKRLFPERPDRLVDAEVRVTGVVGAFRNDRGEFIAPILTATCPDDLEVVTPAPASPFAADLLPLDSIARFRGKPERGHRLRTEGTVSFVLPRSLWLDRVGAGVRIDLAAKATATPLRPGDRVEVSGFLDMSRRIGGLTGGVVRKVGVETPPSPIAIQFADIDAAHGPWPRPNTEPIGSHDGRLVRCTARLLGTLESSERTVLALADGGTTIDAVFPSGKAGHAARLAPGTDVAVTGILQTDLAAPGAGDSITLNPPVERLRILLGGPEDVVVVRAPPWWTPRRLAALLGVVVAVLGATLLWVVLLRRQVFRQTARAVAEESARFKATLDYEITLRERSRLAANLHDTLLQALAGGVLQLDLCRRSLARQRVQDAERQLDVAKRMVKHAAADLRSSVWALRTAPLAGRSFPDSLRALIGHLDAERPGLIRLRVDGEAFPLPRFVEGNLLLVVQEAIRNALHHANAAVIDVRTRFEADARRITLTVADDGSGFAWGTQRGPEQGHFGLQGLGERIEAVGGHFAIDTAPGRGTTVIARVAVQSREGPIQEDPAGAGDDRPFGQYPEPALGDTLRG